MGELVVVRGDADLALLKELDEQHHVLCTGGIVLTADGAYTLHQDEYHLIEFDEPGPAIEDLRVFDGALYVETNGMQYSCVNSGEGYNAAVSKPLSWNPRKPFKNKPGRYSENGVCFGGSIDGASVFESPNERWREAFTVIDYAGYPDEALLITDEGGVYDMRQRAIIGHIMLPKEPRKPPNGIFHKKQRALDIIALKKGHEFTRVFLGVFEWGVKYAVRECW